MASLTCKLSAPIGPRLMHSPGPSPGSLFLRAWRSVCFSAADRARPSNRDKDRQDATLLILDCRLLPPNNRLPSGPSAPVPQPICQACPTAFFFLFHLWPMRPRHGTDVAKGREKERARDGVLSRSTFNRL